MPNIHPSAVIEDNVELDESVKIGAFCHIRDNVKIARNTVVDSHVVIGGNTIIGKNNRIFPFTSIGLEPQDLKYHGEENSLIIGDDNVIREHVTIHPGTEGGGSVTKIGNGCLLMIGVHIAHDCNIGNRVILANNATLAGHVTIGEKAVIGGLSAIHQFVRIGHNAMIGGMSGIESDVIPFGSAIGERANLAGLNLIGLKRRNDFSREDIHALRNAYKALFSDNGTLDERIEKVGNDFKSSAVDEVIDFLRAETSRAICLPKKVS